MTLERTRWDWIGVVCLAFGLGVLSHRVLQFMEGKRVVNSEKTLYLRQLSEMCYALEAIDTDFPTTEMDRSIKYERLRTLQEWYDATKGSVKVE